MAENIVTLPPAKSYPSVPLLKVSKRGKIRDPAPAITSPGEAAAAIVRPLRQADREEFWVIHMDNRHHPVAREVVAIGGSNITVIHPREVFRGSLLNGTVAIILAHNHPSGSPKPSKNDIDLTGRLEEAGQLLQIQVLDHLIVGGNDYVSLKSAGLMGPELS